MDAARSKAALRDFKAASFTQQAIFDGHANIFQLDLHMAVRRVIISEYRQMAQDVDPGRVHRHQYLRLLRMALCFGIGFAHDDGDFAARIAQTRRPPFAAIDDIVIAVADHTGFDVGRIRRRHCWLGHQECRADFAVHQRDHPLPLLIGIGVTHEHFHIAGVGRGAVKHFAGPADTAHFFGAQRVFQIGQAGAFKCNAVIDMWMAR